MGKMTRGISKNETLASMGILFSKVLNEILHSINVSPNTQKKISEVFTLDVLNSGRSPTRGVAG
jgi:hypothetical protein